MNIMDILDVEPNFTQCMGESNNLNFKEELVHVPLPSRSQYFPSIERIPSFVSFESSTRGISVFNADAAIKEVNMNAVRVFNEAILDRVSRNPFDGFLSLKGCFDSFYAIILQRATDMIILENKVEGLIKQTCQIDIIHATEVMDTVTKASSEKTKAYLKDSFEDLENFQWNP
ncbi:hypothetical protein Cgig2_027503 [Carnegiea gigantea]|uniref:Uncharacterized protein n=1 Tax=Carnegiea gigantea TaxID=171969 RepID=A0A9Q1GSB8_9CARY|nr:hypothetical protein Cgig2_027503 [Carnegiea gigantea]